MSHPTPSVVDRAATVPAEDVADAIIRAGALADLHVLAAEAKWRREQQRRGTGWFLVGFMVALSLAVLTLPAAIYTAFSDSVSSATSSTMSAFLLGFLLVLGLAGLGKVAGFARSRVQLRGRRA